MANLSVDGAGFPAYLFGGTDVGEPAPTVHFLISFSPGREDEFYLCLCAFVVHFLTLPCFQGLVLSQKTT